MIGPSIELLLVEDNPGDAVLVQEYLADATRSTVAVRWVKRLDSAIEELHRELPHCVLLDLDLPDAHGVEGLARLLDDTPAVPVVVLTGRRDPALGEIAVQMGAEDYLCKDAVDTDVLVRCVRHAMERHRTRIELEQSNRRVRAMFDHMPVGQCAVSLDGVILEVNADLARMLQRDAAAIVGASVDDFVVTADVAPWPVRREALLAQSTPTYGPIAHRLLATDGSIVEANVTTTIVRGRDGTPRELAVLVEDVTERKRVEASLRAAESTYQAMIEDTHDGVWTLDADDLTIAVNPRLVEILGWTPQEMIGRPAADFAYDDEARREIEARRVHRRQGHGGRALARYRHKDGGEVHALITARPLLDDDGVYVGRMAFVADITEHRRAEVALQESEARFRAIVSNLTDAVSIHDRDGTVLYVTPSYSRMVGGSDPDRVVGQNPLLLIHPEDRHLVASAFEAWASGANGANIIGYRVAHEDGSWRELESVGVNLLDDPAVRGIVVTSRDGTERRRAERELAHRALHDPLTGLPNRTLLLDRLRHAATRRRGPQSTVAVLFVDVDRFKAINDSLGHDAGDTVLNSLAMLLESSVRPGDTVARLGGDEFVVCCENIGSEAAATALAARLAQRLLVPFVVAGEEFHVTVSIGIAVADGNVPIDPDRLLRMADGAMYRVKARGGNGYEIATEQLDHELIERFELESRLRRAIASDELRVYLQPEVDLDSGHVFGFEALVRWQEPNGNVISPAKFIPLAEETGLVVPLGRRVLEEACRQLVELQARRPHDPRYWVSVNLSARQLERSDLAATVAEVLDSSGLDPDRLWLELTETALMSDVETATETLHRLRDLGVHVAVDDFGTGWSSLQYLKRFPVEMLKIDRSFVDGIGRSPEDATIVAAVVSLAHALGLHAIAEGVETEEQRRWLRELGCDLGQGYLWSRPLPEHELDAWLEHHLQPAHRELRKPVDVVVSTA